MHSLSFAAFIVSSHGTHLGLLNDYQQGLRDKPKSRNRDVVARRARNLEGKLYHVQSCEPSVVAAPDIESIVGLEVTCGASGQEAPIEPSVRAPSSLNGIEPGVGVSVSGAVVEPEPDVGPPYWLPNFLEGFQARFLLCALSKQRRISVDRLRCSLFGDSISARCLSHRAGCCLDHSTFLR